MRGNDLVFDAEVVESENVLSRAAFKSVEVFDLKVVLVPFQL